MVKSIDELWIRTLYCRDAEGPSESTSRHAVSALLVIDPSADPMVGQEMVRQPLLTPNIL